MYLYTHKVETIASGRHQAPPTRERVRCCTRDNFDRGARRGETGQKLNLINTDHRQVDVTGVQFQIDLLVERVLALLVEVLSHKTHDYN